MLPRWHVLFGGIFTIIIWIISPNIGLINLLLLFFSSFLIDFDHYLVFIKKHKRLSLKCATNYYNELGHKEHREHIKGIRNKGHFFIFHTLEFQVLIALLGLIWIEFFYIFLGMVFHSLLDIGWMLHKDRLYRREFFLYNWIKNT